MDLLSFKYGVASFGHKLNFASVANPSFIFILKKYQKVLYIIGLILSIFLNWRAMMPITLIIILDLDRRKMNKFFKAFSALFLIGEFLISIINIPFTLFYLFIPSFIILILCGVIFLYCYQERCPITEILNVHNNIKKRKF